MTGNIHMLNLNFILQAILTYFQVTKCEDDAGHICDPWQRSDTKLLQP